MLNLSLPPQGALTTEEAVIASRVDIGLESRNFVACVVAQAYPQLVSSVKSNNMPVNKQTAVNVVSISYYVICYYILLHIIY